MKNSLYAFSIGFALKINIKEQRESKQKLMKLGKKWHSLQLGFRAPSPGSSALSPGIHPPSRPMAAGDSWASKYQIEKSA